MNRTLIGSAVLGVVLVTSGCSGRTKQAGTVQSTAPVVKQVAPVTDFRQEDFGKSLGIWIDYQSGSSTPPPHETWTKFRLSPDQLQKPQETADLKAALDRLGFANDVLGRILATEPADGEEEAESPVAQLVWQIRMAGLSPNDARDDIVLKFEKKTS